MTRFLVAAVAAVAFARGVDGAPRVLALDVGGVLRPIHIKILQNALDQAAREDASAVLIRLGTAGDPLGPGDPLGVRHAMGEKIAASKVPVIAYVVPGGGLAASAGWFLLEAADVAGMAPATTIGVSKDSGTRAGVANGTAGSSRSTERLTGRRSILGQRGRKAALGEQGIGHDESFTETEALNQGWIDVIAPDERRLLEALDGRNIARSGGARLGGTRLDGRDKTLRTAGAEIVEYRVSARERILEAVADPNVAFLLIALGALCIYVECNAPGLVFPGVAGGILGILGASSLAALPVHSIGAVLLILSMAMFVLAARFTSRGARGAGGAVVGAGGAVVMTLGARLLIDGPPEVRIHLATAMAVSIPFGAITVFLLTAALRARANKSATGAERWRDRRSEARTPLAPAGTVLVPGESWTEVSNRLAPPGGALRVVGMDGPNPRVQPKAWGGGRSPGRGSSGRG